MTDGRCAGAALGGETALMDGYQAQDHTTPDGKARLGAGLAPYGAIVVNRDGRRLANEDAGRSEFAPSVLAHPGRMAAEIFDRRIHALAPRMSSYRQAVANGAVREAASFAALAAQFGLPDAAQAETLATYHASVDGVADPFGCRNGLHLLKLSFSAASVTRALAPTQGDLLVDTAAKVQRAGGGVIPGLVAAEGSACGISGHGAAGYLPGNGLGQAFALSFVAGETIALSRRPAQIA